MSDAGYRYAGLGEVKRTGLSVQSAAARLHLASIRDIVQHYAEQAGVPRPAELAHKWQMLMAGSIVFAGYGISDSTRDDYKSLNVRGKIVLVLAGQPAGVAPPAGRRGAIAKQEAAQKNGAVAVLILTPTIPQRYLDTRGNMSLTEYNKTIYPNTYYITEKVAQAIAGADYANLKTGTPKTYAASVELNFRKSTLHLQSSDVLGFLEGTDLKDEIIVLSAHYDHLGKRDTVIYYGADDDGTQVAQDLLTDVHRGRHAGGHWDS